MWQKEVKSREVRLKDSATTLAEVWTEEMDLSPWRKVREKDNFSALVEYGESGK